MEEFIKSFRKNHNLTQEQLALLIGVGQNKISEIENGKAKMNKEMKFKFSKLFNIEKDELHLLRDDFRHFKITFRVDENMYKKITKNAKKANLSINQYLARTYDGGTLKVVEGLREFQLELNRIGTNLNQITTLSQLGKISSVDLKSTQQGFNEIITKLNRIVA